MRHYKFIIITIFAIAFFYGGVLWGAPTQSQINNVYTAVSGGHPFSVDGTSATFSDGTNSWTIFGAVQEKGDSYSRPATWSVTGDYEIKIVDEVISDTIILPFSDPVPNVNSKSSISIQACRGEYEPASFVLRSGASKLSNVILTVSDLILQGSTAKIDNFNVDVRLVKCWFQAGISIDRRDDNNKRLVPELLLHDNELVRVDYDNQVNLVRDISVKTNFTDAEALLPFDVPEKFNQQIWLTFNVPGNATAGKYTGSISVKFEVDGKQLQNAISVELEVKNYELLSPPVECALYYLARYIPDSEGYFPLGSRGKVSSQMLAEFKDMKAHGLTNIAIDHEYKINSSGTPDFSKLSPVLSLFRNAGFTTRRLLYVDWKVSYYSDMKLYGEKLSSLFSLGKQYAFNEFYVYGKDEASYEELQPYRSSFEKVHQVGGKNFMTCVRNVAILMRGDIDVVIMPRDTSLENFNTPSENLVVNGGMSLDLGDSGASWVSTDTAFLNIENGKINKKTGGYVYLTQQLPVERGKTYFLEYEISSLTKASGFILAAGGGSCVASDVLLPVKLGKNSTEFICGTGSMLRFAFGTADQFELDNVVVKSKVAANNVDIIPWAYNGPQAGKEVPGTYYDRFGVSLIEDGFQGECNYAYQTGDCWNDWNDETWRPHVMAYPTAIKPIPTLQWEGWREGIDAMRHKVSLESTTLSGPENLKIK